MSKKKSFWRKVSDFLFGGPLSASLADVGTVLDIFRGSQDTKIPLSVPIKAVDLYRNPNFLYEVDIGKSVSNTILIGVFFDGKEVACVTNRPAFNKVRKCLYFTEIPGTDAFRKAGTHTIEIKMGPWSVWGNLGKTLRAHTYTVTSGVKTFAVTGSIYDSQ